MKSKTNPHGWRNQLPRRRSYRPHLEALENRLPPGDTFLGALLASAWMASNPGTSDLLKPTNSGPVALSALVAFRNLGSLPKPGDLQTAPEVAPLTVLILPLVFGQPASNSPSVPFENLRVGDQAAVLLRGSARFDGPLGLSHPSDAPFSIAFSTTSENAWLPSLVQTPGSQKQADLPFWANFTSPGNGNVVPEETSALYPFRFDQISGQLVIQANVGDNPVREALTPSGYLDVLLNGRHHSSDPSSPVFDSALAGANQSTLMAIRLVDATAHTPLVLGAQVLVGNLNVHADGPVEITGNITSGSWLAITGSIVTVRAAVHGSSVNVTSTGLVNIESAGSITAGGGSSGGRLMLDARVLINTGRLQADGGRGGEILVHADNILNGGQITADGTEGDGGTVMVAFTGSYIATVPALTSANGSRAGTLTIDGGSTGMLFSSGRQQATGAMGGRVNLRGQDLALKGATVDVAGAAVNGVVNLAGVLAPPLTSAPSSHLIDPHPTRGGAFGFTTTKLSNGNLLVTNPQDNFIAPHAGAVALLNGRTGALLSYLIGSSANDRVGDAGTGSRSNGPGPAGPDDVGDSGVVGLPNGNFVVPSPSWNDNRGAVTWGNGMVGITGLVDAGNSLIGSNSGDHVGSTGVTALINGNYLVASSAWNGGRGAATWGDGTAGVSGVVDESNSLIGSNSGDEVGRGVTALSNGNYLIVSPAWNGGSFNGQGAVTWGDGTVGVTGVIDANNSLVGSFVNDRIGSNGVTALRTGNYVVVSPGWNGNRGAVTWVNGMVGITGAVDASNSLVGSSPNDWVGYSGVTALSNGNYVVASPFWNGQHGAVTWGDGTKGVRGDVDPSNSFIDSGGVQALSNGNYLMANPSWNGNRGAVTWGDGTVGIRGAVDSSNSLVGGTQGDQVGYGVTALSNGNYVVASPFWNGQRGAVTWGDVTLGISGIVDSNNSLIGNNPGDQISYNGISAFVIALTNGNYVVPSPAWNGNRGAVTWGDGKVGVIGAVDDSNSLFGSTAEDRIGGSITALRNGNYVISSPDWNGATYNGRGAVTWGNGTVASSGVVDANNSLIGTNNMDHIGNYGITALTNGNYVVDSIGWDGNRGAVTWGDGTVGVHGAVSAGNSLVGSLPYDQVGYGGVRGVTPLDNGNYVVYSIGWDNARGAVTWGNGTIGVSGAVNPSNSLVGNNTHDLLGDVTALNNGNYLIISPYWNGDRGAVTWGDGHIGVRGVIDARISLVGNNSFDQVGRGGATALNNGNYVIFSPYWNSNRGAVTWGDGNIGVWGVVNTGNSLVGTSGGDFGGSGITPLSNGNYVVVSPLWNANRGAVTWGDGTVGINGVVDPSNSLLGSLSGDQVGSGGVTALNNGNFVVASSLWNGNRGAVTWGDGTAGFSGIVDPSNSLVGSTAGDQVGSRGIWPLSNGNYVVLSPNWDGNRGAVTWGDGTTGITGPVSEDNSLVG